jgi:Ca-activated chloride channel family protein
MSFLAPARLVLLVIPLALLVAYVVVQRRRAQYAIRFTNLELLDKVAPETPGWRRHVPAAAMLAAVLALAVATARPAVSVEIPQEQATVILAIDTSISMSAEDVDPDRLRAAQDAAYSFMAEVPKEMQVGLIGFSETIRVMSPPTTDHTAVEAAIGRLSLDFGTAIGEAIFASLDLLTEADALADPADDAEMAIPPATVLLLSDGETTSGRPDEDATAAASELGIPVSTVAFGTDEGSIIYQGEEIPVPVDEAALSAIADATDGQFFDADSADDLRSVFEDVGSEIGRETEEREITDWFAIAGLLLAGLAAAGSLAWFSRLP